MKIKLPVTELRTTLDRVIGVVEKNSRLEILSNVLVAVDDSSISITASNTETEVMSRVQTEGKISETGQVCVEAKKLSQLLKTLDDNSQVTLATDESSVRVTCGRSKVKLSSAPANDFPNVDSESEKWSVRDLQIDREQFITGMSRVGFAQGINDTREIFNGTHFELTEGQLRFVCTDGHRLATTKIDVDSDTSAACTLPRRAVDHLRKCLAKGSQDLLVSISEDRLEVRSPDFKVISQVISGKYPDYTRVIPNEEAVPCKVTLPRSDILSTLKLSLITSHELNHGLTMAFDDRLTIESKNGQQDNSSLSMAVDWDAEPMTLNVNGNYLMDALKVIEGNDIQMNFGQNSKAIAVKSANDESYLCVIMQLQA